MKKMHYLSFMAVVMFYSITTAQREGDQLVLGYWSDNAKEESMMYFDFSNLKLQIIKKPSLKMSISGTASNICLPNGEPLIWTNGMQIMDRNGSLVEDSIAYKNNGEYWQYYTSQNYIPYGFREPNGALILPIPDSQDEFSIIYHYALPHPEIIFEIPFFLETKVRKLENGNWETIYKDSIIGPIIERYKGAVSAVRHANGRDWWVINFKRNSDEYYVHLLDPNGLHFDHIGHLNEIVKFGLGQMTFSPNGNYFARMDAIDQSTGEFITLYRFDRCYGHLELVNTFHKPNGFFTGVAFSPSEQYFYANNNVGLWQWDLESDDIQSSEILVDTFDGFVPSGWLPTYFGPMFAAPDGKIYMVPSGGSSLWLHIINRPDLPGKESQFVQHDWKLRQWNDLTAPNLPNYRLGPMDGSSCDTLGLNNLAKSRWRHERDQPEDPFLIRFTDLAYYDPDTWHWDFGDGSTSDTRAPLHTYEPGFYHVCQTVSNEYATDSTCQWIEILPTDVQEELNRKLPDISINPNPFREFITIESRSGIFRTGRLQIYDIHGRLVSDYSEIMIPSTTYLPDLPPGLYLCNLKEENGTGFSVKLMKQ